MLSILAEVTIEGLNGRPREFGSGQIEVQVNFRWHILLGSHYSVWIVQDI